EEAFFCEPDAKELYGHIGAAFAEKGWFASALILHEKSGSGDRARPEARVRYGLAALALGRFAEGWTAYESRFYTEEDRVVRRPEPPPYWQGQDLKGKSILIWCEQGLGDEIIYASMIPDIVARGARCLIACSQRMVPIFKRSFATCEV